MRGKGNLWCRYQYNHRDHPRLCGEKFLDTALWAVFLGSPPPMRGKGFPSILYRVYMQDHPRLCGEKNFFGLCQHQYLGSPPPMRGKVFDALDDSIKNGITPAYAGKSGA